MNVEFLDSMLESLNQVGYIPLLCMVSIVLVLILIEILRKSSWKKWNIQKIFSVLILAYASYFLVTLIQGYEIDKLISQKWERLFESIAIPALYASMGIFLLIFWGKNIFGITFKKK